MFDFPMWAGVIMGVVGIFISQISVASSMICFGGWAMFFVSIIASAIIHERYRNKLEEELRYG